jgi:hypothetical protein
MPVLQSIKEILPEASSRTISRSNGNMLSMLLTEIFQSGEVLALGM